MGNPAVEAAIKGLQLAGIPVPPASFIEMLINEGQDVVSAVARLVSVIDALGGNAWQVLEEVAYGIEQYGPTSYAQRLVDQHFAPSIQIVQDIHRNKTVLLDTHHSMLASMDTYMTTLAPQNTVGVANGQVQTFSGTAATAMHTRYNEIVAQTHRLLDNMDQSRQIDEDLLNQLKIVMQVGMGMLVVDVALLAIGLTLAPFTVGGSLAISGIVDAGLLGLEASIFLGAIIACFVAWGLRHALLALSTSLAHPAQTASTGVTIHPINLTKYPKLDNKQQEAANELDREFGGAVQKSWIEYLIHVLGLKNVSPEIAKQVIRCLRSKGYIDIAQRMKSEGLDPASGNNVGLASDFKRAWNAIMDQLNPRTLQGAWAEKNNIDTTIPELGPKDHVTKTKAGIKAVQNCVNALDQKIADYRTPPKLRLFYQNLKKALENTRDAANRLSKGNRNQGPSTWEDPKGEVPFGKDIIEASGCLPMKTMGV